MKFRAELIKNLLNNQDGCIEKVIRSIHPSEKVVIAQGYGASAGVPKRFLAYAVPALRLASQLSENTEIEFYFAAQGVYRVNGKYFNESISIMKNELFKYVKDYYPQLRNRVSIMEDTVLSLETKNVIGALFPFAQKVAETIPSIKQFVVNRGGENALRYMLEHLLYMRDPILVDGEPNTELLVPGMSTKYDHVIMIGGPAEKIFWQFRQEMLKLCGFHAIWKSYQFFTAVGDPPTYHVFNTLEQYGQVEFSDLASFLSALDNSPDPFGKKKNVARDYMILLQDFEKVEYFKLKEDIDPSVLRNGYQLLQSRSRDFLKTT